MSGPPECQLPAPHATTSGGQDGAAATAATTAGSGAPPAPPAPAALDTPGARRSSDSGGSPPSPTGEAAAQDATPDAAAVPGQGQRSPEAAAVAPDAASPDSTAAGGAEGEAVPLVSQRDKLGIPDAWQGVSDSSDDEVPQQTHPEVGCQSASMPPSHVAAAVRRRAVGPLLSLPPHPHRLVAPSPFPNLCLDTLCILTLRHS